MTKFKSNLLIIIVLLTFFSCKNPFAEIIPKDQENISVSSLLLHKRDKYIEIGQTGTISNTINPVNANNKTILWSSANDTIATVNQSGVITAESQGQTVITAMSEDGSFTKTCNITSYENIPVESVSIFSTAERIQINEREHPSVTFTPLNPTNRTYTLTSSNEAVAIIEQPGYTNEVLNVGLGSTTITVTTEDGNYTNSFLHTVSAADSTAPAYQSLCLTSSTIRVWYSEPINEVQAKNVANYVITDNSASVSTIDYDSSINVAILSINKSLINNESLTLTISNIEDSESNTMIPIGNTITNFTPLPPLDGLKIEIIGGKIFGNVDAGLRNTAAYIYAFHSGSVSADNMIGMSALEDDGSFAFINDMKNDPYTDYIFTSGSYNFLIQDITNQSLSLKTTINVP